MTLEQAIIQARKYHPAAPLAQEAQTVIYKYYLGDYLAAKGKFPTNAQLWAWVESQPNLKNLGLPTK